MAQNPKPFGAALAVSCALLVILSPVRAADAWDPGDDAAATGTWLYPDATRRAHGPHTLDALDTADWFRIDMTAGVTYRFDTIGGTGDSVGELYRSGGSILVASNDDSGGNGQFLLTYTPATSETHYLKVRTFSPGGQWSGYLSYGTVVSSPPVLNVSERVLDFGAVRIGDNPTRTIVIRNTGGGTLSGTISTDRIWIEPSLTSFSGNYTELTVTVKTVGIWYQSRQVRLLEQQYNGSVTIQSNGGTRTIAVRLTPTCVIPKPNPYSLSAGVPVRFWGSGVVPNNTVIRIYALSGALVRTLEERSGLSEIPWDGTTSDGRQVAPGVYLYVSQSPTEHVCGRLTVVP